MQLRKLAFLQTILPKSELFFLIINNHSEILIIQSSQCFVCYAIFLDFNV